MKRLIVFALFFTGLAASAQEWQPLFNGKNLSGWRTLGGKAPFTVVDGTIVGTPKLGEGNSFLATKAEYGDFILEFEFKVSDGLNSGVQLRSHVTDRERVYGYQFEIDPSDRAWTGGVYDEARRGWLYPMTKNPDAQIAFRHNTWNKARIECYGNSIRTWVNGIPCARLWDDADPSGFIALQVHQVGSKEDEAKSVCWRDIRICTRNVADFLSSQDIIEEYNAIDNTISPWEKANGWTLLWDGETTKGWRGAYSYEFPSKGWVIEDGVLTVNPSGKSEGGGDIITEELLHHYIVKIDFKLSEGADGGIKYFIDPDYSLYGGRATGCEYQLIDDGGVPEEKFGYRNNHTLASLFDLIPADAGKTYYRGGWNTAMIVVNANRVEHWLNDRRVLYYERNNPMWEALVSHSKYKDFERFGNIKDGYLLLQDEFCKVSFKNIKIKELRKYPVQ